MNLTVMAQLSQVNIMLSKIENNYPVQLSDVQKLSANLKLARHLIHQYQNFFIQKGVSLRGVEDDLSRIENSITLFINNKTWQVVGPVGYLSAAVWSLL